MIKDPLLLDLPDTIRTSRLTLRPMMPGDGKALFEAIEESRNVLDQWLPWVEGVKSFQDSEKTAREFYANFILRKGFPFLFFENDRLLGCCSIHYPDWSIPAGSLGSGVV